MSRDPIIPKPGHVERWITYCSSGRLAYAYPRFRFDTEDGPLGLSVGTEDEGAYLDEDDLRELYHPSVVAEVQKRLGIAGSKGLRAMVSEFHAIIGQIDPPTPQAILPDRVRLRARLITEEYFETMRALLGESERLAEAEAVVQNALDPAFNDDPAPDLVAIADGCVDLAYVTEGTMLEFGINSDPVTAEVHRTNMAKVSGPVREDGKRLKPPGWTPPDIEGELCRQGWKP